MIFKAVKAANVRALVSAGWGGMGGKDVPDNIFILGNVPHDWLFDKVVAVCHHGGAGTTAIGLYKGRPTIVVPFFGDQPFWGELLISNVRSVSLNAMRCCRLEGEMIREAGAGPQPIPQKKLSVECLTEAIKFTLQPEAQAAAKKMGEEIRAEVSSLQCTRTVVLIRSIEWYAEWCPLLLQASASLEYAVYESQSSVA